MPDAQATLYSVLEPITVTMTRNDGGFLEVIPRQIDEGTVAVAFDETSSFAEGKRAMRIQEDGQVYAH
ncbi:MAG: hypothetical protein Kow00121_27120 [Elainellaceae cyanobacterium]